MAALGVAAVLCSTPASGASSGSATHGLVTYAQVRAGQAQLMVMRADGTGARRISPGVIAYVSSLSPDGRHIAFSGLVRHSPGGPRLIWVMRRDGTGVRRLTSLAGHKDSPSWSPDGTAIVHAALVYRAVSAGQPVHGWTCELRVVDVASRKERVLHAFGVASFSEHAYVEGACAMFPSWSPEGDEILFNQSAYAYTSPAHTHVPMDVWAVRPDGSGLRRLPNVQGFAPQWSPDGSRLVLAAPVEDPEGTWQVVTMSPDGSERRVLTTSALDASWTTFSPDGRYVLFTAVRADDARYAQLFRVPVGGGTPVQVTRGEAHHLVPSWTR